MNSMFGLDKRAIEIFLDADIFSLGRYVLDFYDKNRTVFSDLEKRRFIYVHPKAKYYSSIRSTGFTIEELFSLRHKTIFTLNGYQLEHKCGLNASNFSLIKNNKRTLSLPYVCAFCLIIDDMMTQDRYNILRCCIDLDHLDPIMLGSFVTTSMIKDDAIKTSNVFPSREHPIYNDYCFFAHAAIQAHVIRKMKLPAHFNTKMWKDTYAFYETIRTKL